MLSMLFHADGFSCRPAMMATFLSKTLLGMMMFFVNFVAVAMRKQTFCFVIAATMPITHSVCNRHSHEYPQVNGIAHLVSSGGDRDVQDDRQVGPLSSGLGPRADWTTQNQGQSVVVQNSLPKSRFLRLL